MSGWTAAAIEEARLRLEAGEVVVYPTETLYGLGASVFSASALARLQDLKSRPADKPVPVLVAGSDMLAVLVDRVSPLAAELIGAFWPGPLTLVLPAKAGVPEVVTGGGGGVGVRVSSHPAAQALVRAAGVPLTAPSANPASEPPPRTVEEARRYFGTAVGAYVDGGRLPGGASTVARVGQDAVEILREGTVGVQDLTACVGAHRVRVASRAEVISP